MSIERVSEQLFRNYLRSPTFYRIFEAFRRDLRVVDALSALTHSGHLITTVLICLSPAWKNNVWNIERELGLISLCDISRVPQGFQFFHSDRVLCPICQPNPDDFRKAVNSLPTKHQKRAYFNLNTVPAAVLEGHYRKKYVLACPSSFSLDETSSATCPFCCEA